MLVLKRQIDEKIFIDFLGKQVVITLVDAGSSWAKFGFEAPPEVMIVRDNAVDTTPKQRSEHESKV